MDQASSSYMINQRAVQAVLRGESPLTLAREALWRVQRKWLRRQFPARLSSGECPVRLRRVGYYDCVRRCDASDNAVLWLDFAEAICRGEFRFPGYETAKLGTHPAWDVDFVSGKSWPQQPSNELRLIRHDGSDVKVPWELSRLQFLPVLGKAFAASGDARYRHRAMELLSDWIGRNPVGMGVNWTIAMEAALRAISICLTLDLLAPFAKHEWKWQRRVEHSLWQHVLYIEAHSEFSYLSRSNHYLSNIAGLYSLSVFLEGARMTRLRRQCRAALEKEIQLQVYEDGGDYEASTGYHVLVTQMFALPYLLARASGDRFSNEYQDRLARMFGWIAQLADGHGRLPLVGDCDDGRVELLADDLEQMCLPVRQRHALSVKSLLRLGEELFPTIRGCRAAKSGAATSGTCTVFPDSGIVLARCGEAEVMFLAMPNGMGGKGSHTHNDKLSVVVRLAGEELFCDSGTGCYTRDAVLRNRLRRTSAHNTVVIDGEEQNRIDGSAAQLFRIGHDAKVTRTEQRLTDNGGVALEASHLGYVRLGVRHSRSLTLRTDTLYIDDHIEGIGEHEFNIFFHVPPIWMVQTAGQGGQPSCCLVGPRTVTIRWRSPVAFEVRSEETVISPAYGLTIAASRIQVHGRGPLPLTVTTQISWR